MSEQVLEKVIDRTMVNQAGGGILTAEQSDRFIDYMWDETALLNTARTIRMRANTIEIDRIGVARKIARVATEAVDDGVNAGVAFGKVSLTTTKIRLDWEISTETLEDNIEGTDFEDHVARLMSAQLGNDLEDVAINGDAASSDQLYKAFNGYKKLALTGGHVVSAGGDEIDRAIFNTAIRTMPRMYKQRREALRFWTSSGFIQDFIFSATQQSGTVIMPEQYARDVIEGRNALSGPAGGQYPLAFGIPVVEVPLFNEALTGSYSGASGNHGYVELTDPKNRIVGIKRAITVYREFKPKKDTVEFTVFTRMGVGIENLDAYVVITNVKPATT